MCKNYPEVQGIVLAYEYCKHGNQFNLQFEILNLAHIPRKADLTYLCIL